MTIDRTNLLETAGATFSDCGAYRYLLWRSWNEKLPGCTFIMLNPSTANEFENDRTVAKCIKFAIKWGFGKLYVVNLFAWRSTDPEAMKLVKEPIGPENDYWIAHACLNAPFVICAWGNDGDFMNRSSEILEYFRVRKDIEKDNPILVKTRAYALLINKTGQPAHPLYQPIFKELIEL